MLTVSSDEIRCRVEKLRRQFQTSDPFILCRQLDVQLKGVNFGETEHSIKAMTTVIFRIRMIQYNSNLPRTLLTFILAHELGHLFLHKKANAIFMDSRTQFNTDKYEREADTFAMELLVPDSVIFEHPDLTIGQLARLTGYAEELLKNKEFFTSN